MSTGASFPWGIPLGFPYREARDGIWGEPTATLNWCEEDYSITPYVAELVNVLTNLAFLYLGVKGMRNCLAQNFAPVLFVSFLGYSIIGLGSMAFHATLWYSMQLADELPMIYTVCILAQATFSQGRSNAVSTLLGFVFFGVAAFITIYYYLNKNPIFHQVAYASLTISVVVYGALVTKYQLEPTLQMRSPARAKKIMQEMWTLMGLGVFMFVFGFFLWSLDNIFCRYLIAWRGHMMLPWAIVLEGHGWWHLLTGLGAYNLIVWRVWLSCCLDGKEDGFELRRRTVFGIPEVVPLRGGSKAPKAKRT